MVFTYIFAGGEVNRIEEDVHAISCTFSFKDVLLVLLCCCVTSKHRLCAAVLCSAGSMVVRFIEDGSRYWFPLAEIQRFLKDMQSKGRDAESDTIGQGSHAFAAQVLAGTLVAKKKASGMTSSSATAGTLPSFQPHCCAHVYGVCHYLWKPVSVTVFVSVCSACTVCVSCQELIAMPPAACQASMALYISRQKGASRVYHREGKLILQDCKYLQSWVTAQVLFWKSSNSLSLATSCCCIVSCMNCRQS